MLSYQFSYEVDVPHQPRVSKHHVSRPLFLVAQLRQMRIAE